MGLQQRAAMASAARVRGILADPIGHHNAAQPTSSHLTVELAEDVAGKEGAWGE